MASMNTPSADSVQPRTPAQSPPPPAPSVWFVVRETGTRRVDKYHTRGSTLRVGRAWNNDIVLDDPCVAPHHLLLNRHPEHGGWMAQDLGTLNGIRLQPAGARRPQRRATQQVALNSGDSLHIGQSSISLHSANEPVAAEQLLNAGTGRNLAAAIFCTLLSVALVLLGAWLEVTGELNPQFLISPALALVATLIFWVGFWSVLCRVFTGRSRFATHFCIAAVLLAGFLLGDFLLNWATYALSAGWMSRYTSFVPLWILLPLACFLHLRTFSPARMPLKALSALVLAGIGLGTGTMNMMQYQKRYGTQPHTDLWPASWRVAAPQSQQDFFREAQKTLPELEKLRQEPAAEDIY